MSTCSEELLGDIHHHTASGMSDDSQVSLGKNQDKERQKKADKVKGFNLLFTLIYNLLFISGVQMG